MAAIEKELLEQFKKLDTSQKKQVLDFVRGLTHPKGELVKDFLERTTHIQIPRSDLEIMKQVAEEDEERIDWHDWKNPPAVFD